MRALAAAGFDDHTPAYVQIGRRIEALIRDGSLPEGTTLPSERKLAAMLGVSRITVQHSYNDLRRQKLITSHGRRGSIVARRVTSPLNRLRGFTDEMTELGRVPSSRIVESRICTNRQIATIFGLGSNTALLRLNRIRYADGMPMSNETAWYNLAEAPMLAEADLSQSVYHLLATHG
ncbi:MAG: GntR family transcriptional regulator, partial [Sphingobium sp.]